MTPGDYATIGFGIGAAFSFALHVVPGLLLPDKKKTAKPEATSGSCEHDWSNWGVACDVEGEVRTFDPSTNIYGPVTALRSRQERVCLKCNMQERRFF